MKTAKITQKAKALETRVARLMKDLEREAQSVMGDKRARIVQGIESVMREQDLVIELLREVVGDDDTVDTLIKSEMQKGPLRVRPPSREEIWIDVRKGELTLHQKREQFLSEFAQDGKRNIHVQTEEAQSGKRGS